MTPEQKALFDNLTKLQQNCCLAHLQGMNQTDAHRHAGGKAKTEEVRNTAASEIFRKPQVIDFLESMKVSAVDSVIMEREEALERLTQVGRFNLGDICEFNGHEWVLKDSSKLTKEQTYCLAELSETRDGTKIKTHSPVEAIKQLRAMQGWDKPVKVAQTDTEGEDLEAPDVPELARKVARMLASGVSS